MLEIIHEMKKLSCHECRVVRSLFMGAQSSNVFFKRIDRQKFCGSLRDLDAHLCDKFQLAARFFSGQQNQPSAAHV